MKAAVNCSNCGAEITNLNLSWGKQHWLWTLWWIPLLLLCFLNMYSLLRSHTLLRSLGNFRKDLKISVIETRKSDNGFEILGTIQNQGSSEWQNIAIDVEFYDKDGKFIDEATSYTSTSIEPGKSENFKVLLPGTSTPAHPEDSRMEVKVSFALSR